MFGYRFDFFCRQIHDKRLGIVAVGCLPFFNVEADTVECFGCSMNDDLFAVGRKTCRVGKRFVLPEGVDVHGFQVDHIHRSFAERTFGKVFFGNRKKQLLYVGCHIVQRGGLFSECELLRQTGIEKIAIDIIFISVTRLSVFGRKQAFQSCRIVEDLGLFDGVKHRFFVGSNKESFFWKIFGKYVSFGF